MNLATKINNELDQELEKQTYIIYGSASLALHKYWGWGQKRIENLFNVSAKACQECATTTEISMIEMLENETGIELKPENESKGWREVAYLNADIHIYDFKMTRAQWYYMKMQQKKWIPTQVIATLFLAMHRQYGFGAKRLVRLLNQIHEIQNEFDNKQMQIAKKCYEETKVDVIKSSHHEVIYE